MNEAQAIKELETKYASLEDFALQLFVHPKRAEIMSASTSWEKKAKYLKLSPKATTVILAMSKRFQRTMKELSISHNWNFEAQDEANKQFVADTKNKMEKPSERVKVASYLNRESGIGIEEDKKQGGLVINLTFNGQSMTDMMNTISGAASDQKTITLDPNGNPVRPHLPNISGAAIPDGVTQLQQGQRIRLDTTSALLPDPVPSARLKREVTTVTGSTETGASVADSATESITKPGQRYSPQELARKLID